jgi:hypothetical protein
MNCAHIFRHKSWIFAVAASLLLLVSLRLLASLLMQFPCCLQIFLLLQIFCCCRFTAAACHYSRNASLYLQIVSLMDLMFLASILFERPLLLLCCKPCCCGWPRCCWRPCCVFLFLDTCCYWRLFFFSSPASYFLRPCY